MLISSIGKCEPQVAVLRWDRWTNTVALPLYVPESKGVEMRPQRRGLEGRPETSTDVSYHSSQAMNWSLVAGCHSCLGRPHIPLTKDTRAALQCGALHSLWNLWPPEDPARVKLGCRSTAPVSKRVSYREELSVSVHYTSHSDFPSLLALSESNFSVFPTPSIVERNLS